MFSAIRIAMALAAILLLAPGAARAQTQTTPCTVPNIFKNGTTADADQVNANFAALSYCQNGIPGTMANGTTNDGPVIQAYLNNLPPRGGIAYLSRGGAYRIAQTLTIPPNVTLDCQQSPGLTGATNLDASFNFGVLGGIRLDPSATIIQSSGSHIQNCPILRFGATFPVVTPSAYAGTAVTAAAGGSADIWLQNVLIVGFAFCVDYSAPVDRFHLINVECDGVNGYKIGPSFDSSEIRQARAWPWGTITAGGTPQRAGTGFLFTGTDRIDDLKVFGILDFGHAVGMDIENPGNSCCNIHLDNVWLDSNTTTGLIVKANNVSFGKLWVWVVTGQAVPGVVVQTGGGNGAGPIIDNLVVENAQDCVQVLDSSGIRWSYAQLNCTRYAINANVAGNPSAAPQVIGGQTRLFADATPYVNLPAAVTGNTTISLGQTNTIAPNTLIGATPPIPLYGLGEYVTPVTGFTAPLVTIAGPGQQTAAMTDNGPYGSSLMLKSTGNLLGDGGSLLFGATTGHMRHFAAIKGSQINGNQGTQGDLHFAGRVLENDTALTDQFLMNTSGGGYFQWFAKEIVAHLSVCDSTTEGSMAPRSDISSPIGSIAVGSGTASGFLVCNNLGGVYNWIVQSVQSAVTTWADNFGTCTPGAIVADTSFIYVCTGLGTTNNVKRAALSAF